MDLNEAQTRRRIIDKRLALAGWDVNDAAQVTQELDIDVSSTRSATGETAGHSAAADNPFAGHQFADYALNLHGKPAAVVEAKRTMRDAEVGREQALQYAQNIQRLHGGRLPLIFYTNGYDNYFWEYDFYPPAKVYGFPTWGDLEWLVQRGGERRPLSVEMINTGIVGREPGALIPMPVRLFKARLDRLEAAAHAVRQDIVEAVKGDLRRDLAELPKNNVVVLENAAHLARAGADEFWRHLAADGIGFLRSVVAPILRARSGADFKALRFETEVVELGTAVLADNKESFEAIKQSLQAQVSELPLTVNIVAKERELIDAVQFEDWWLTPTEDKLRSLIDRLAPLMKYRQARKDPMMHLDLEDVSFAKEWIECGPGHERVAVSAYREKAEAFVREMLGNSLVLRKIEAGEPVTEDELHELADELERNSLRINEDLLRRVYDNKRASFVQFIRHMLGRERLEPWSSTVTKGFDDFIAKHDTFSSQQILFLQTLKTFIIQTGEVSRESLISQPFTNIHPRGILGLFQSQERGEIEKFIQGMGYYNK